MEKNIKHSTYYSDDNKREATIKEDIYHYIIEMYQNKKLYKVELIDKTKHNIYYVEDLAENFTLYVGSFK